MERALVYRGFGIVENIFSFLTVTIAVITKESLGGAGLRLLICCAIFMFFHGILTTIYARKLDTLFETPINKVFVVIWLSFGVGQYLAILFVALDWLPLSYAAEFVAVLLIPSVGGVWYYRQSRQPATAAFVHFDPSIEGQIKT